MCVLLTQLWCDELLTHNIAAFQMCVIRMWLTSTQNYAGYFFLFFLSTWGSIGRISAPRSKQNHASSERPAPAGPRPSLYHHLNRRSRAQNSPFGNAASCRIASAAPFGPAVRLACTQHNWNQNCTTQGGGINKNISPRSFSVSLHAPRRQQIPCSVPSCTIPTAAQQRWGDYTVPRNMQ